MTYWYVSALACMESRVLFETNGSQPTFFYQIETTSDTSSVISYLLGHLDGDVHVTRFRAIYYDGRSSNFFNGTSKGLTYNDTIGNLDIKLDNFGYGDEGLYYFKVSTSFYPEIRQCTFIYLLGEV